MRCRLPLAFVGAVAAACGSRTGLLVDDGNPGSGGSSSGGGTVPAPVDAAAYNTLPSIDASIHEAATPTGCTDASPSLVYTLTQQNELYTFDPSSLVFSLVGRLACNAGTSTPFSMAVDRQGTAYSVFAFSGNLFRLHTANGLCEATPYLPNQQGFNVFGMGYVATSNGVGETLYVTDNEYGGPLSKGLAWIDTSTFTLHFIAPFSAPIMRGEFTGTADGRLFMFYANTRASGSHIAQVDPLTAKIVAQDDLNVVAAGAAWAFAYWGGDFWIFTSYSGPSTVTRFTPSTHIEVSVTMAPGQIVGAGVSTCAPQ